MAEKGVGRNKRALLIGINEYPKLPDYAQLKGCENDVLLMRELLVSSLRFPPENVNVLLGARAVRNAIRDALDKLVEDCTGDDIVVVHYSGHGSSVPAAAPDKPSGYDESIVPHDSGRLRADYPVQAESRDITDREIQEWLERLTQKTRHVTLVFDSCHSGSITRLTDPAEEAANGTRARWIPPDPRPEGLLPPPLAGREVGSGWLPTSDKYVLLAACAHDESAFELDIGVSGDRVRYGAFTYYLTRELKQAPERGTYRDIWEKVALQVANRFQGRQNPQLEGARDRQLFDVEDYAPMRYLLVRKREGDSVELDGGAVHGLAVGSKFEVYGAGTRRLGEGAARLALAEVTIVGSVTSSAKLSGESPAGSVDYGARAVEVSRPDAEVRMKVYLAPAPDAFAPHVEELRRELAGSELLDVEDSRERAHAEAHILLPDSPRDEWPAPSAAAAPVEEVWAIVGREDRTFWMTPCPLRAPASAGAVRENLERIWRYRKLLELSNPNSALNGQVEFTLLQNDGQGGWREAVAPDGLGDPIFRHGEHIAFRVVNRSRKTLYASVLDFGLSRSIGVLYPGDRGSEPVGPAAARSAAGGQESQTGGELTVGKNKPLIKLSFPVDMTFLAAPRGGPTAGKEVFKLVVTTRPHDLGFLGQSGLRRDPERERLLRHPLERYAYLSASSGSEREAQLQLSPDDEWLTVERSFWLQAGA